MRAASSNDHPPVSPVIGWGDKNETLADDEVRGIISQHAESLALEGRRILVLIPDGTRSAPLPMLVKALREAFAEAAQLDLLIALGTHPPMDAAAIDRLLGCTAEERGEMRVYNHAWDDPTSFVTLGEIKREEVARISGGRLSQQVEVRVNRLVTEYDHVLVCGPVFPHEVVGYSGGNKYFFPGVGGKELIDLSHWLGALITSYDIIGTLGTTPVRALIDRATSLIATPRSAVCFVVSPGDSERLHGAFAGPVDSAWELAAKLSSQVHVTYVDRPFSTVVSVIPPMYDEMWVAAKGMYKLEPVVADGGELIIYAPHVKHISRVHGQALREVGYHTRDYFLAHWEQFQHQSWGVLAHSTHLRGAGTFDASTGQEHPRISVVLATGIPEDECRAIGLTYRDPQSIDIASLQNRADEGILVVPKAGEMLFHLRNRDEL